MRNKFRLSNMHWSRGRICARLFRFDVISKNTKVLVCLKINKTRLKEDRSFGEADKKPLRKPTSCSRRPFAYSCIWRLKWQTCKIELELHRVKATRPQTQKKHKFCSPKPQNVKQLKLLRLILENSISVWSFVVNPKKAIKHFNQPKLSLSDRKCALDCCLQYYQLMFSNLMSVFRTNLRSLFLTETDGYSSVCQVKRTLDWNMFRNHCKHQRCSLLNVIQLPAHCLQLPFRRGTFESFEGCCLLPGLQPRENLSSEHWQYGLGNRSVFEFQQMHHWSQSSRVSHT